MSAPGLGGGWWASWRVGRQVLWVLPAPSGDAGPAEGEAARGAGASLAADARFAVAMFGPGAASPSVAGELADGIAGRCVTAEAEADSAVATAGAGGRCKAGEELGGREMRPAVADLGDRARRADSGAAGQRPEGGLEHGEHQEFHRQRHRRLDTMGGPMTADQ